MEASVKRLINQEISKQSNIRKNAPSIVARLMGVDMLPLDTKTVVQPIDRKTESTETKFKKKKNERSSAANLSLKSYPSMRMELNSLYDRERAEADGWNECQKLEKLRPREHPQEEELQKFKKEFEAWQAARFMECSNDELGKIPHNLLAQHGIDNQKMVLDAVSVVPASDKTVGRKGLISKARSQEKGSSHPRYKMEQFPTEQKECFSSRNRNIGRNLERSFINYDQRLDKSSASTRIVILKPGPDRICNHEYSSASGSGTLEDRGSIEDFLEEVKKRLKCELQGKALKRGSVGRGIGIEIPFSERASHPKRIAQHIAKQVRENVTRGIEGNLLRSESTRSYRSEIQFNGPGSPEFINKNTRRYLSERLRNVLKRGTRFDAPIVVSGTSGSSPLENEKARLKQVGGKLKAGNEPSCWDIVKDEEEMQTRSFRRGDENEVFPRKLSARNLIRSLSAPVPGTSFGKLLLEDRHILTGAQIRRKREALENMKMQLKKCKKERLNIKEKVSNIRYSFTLRGRLFRKKIQSMVDSHNCEYDAEDIMSGPTVVMNYGDRHIMENSTEVPPSPASVCSSAQDEFWRPVDSLSVVSTPDLTVEQGSSMPQVFKEISLNLNALRRQLNQLRSNGPKGTTIEEEQEPVEPLMADLEDKAEAYVRELLVASGFYDGSSDKCLSRWDPLARRMSNSVFEEVENSCRKKSQDDENTTRDHDERKVEHKMLFDLLNETLSTVLGPPVTISRFRKKIIGSSMLPPLSGKKLLDCVWESSRKYLYPVNYKFSCSLDSMVANNLGSTPWSGLIDEEVNALGKEMGCLIIGDLIEEVVNDMHC